MSEVIRSFIAVPIPPEVAARMAAAVEELRPAGPDVKWVGPESFHITLKFLGGVKQEELERTWRLVAAGVRRRPGFSISFRGVGAFPTRNRPRVIWVAVDEGKAELADLAVRTEQVCADCGFDAENRPYQAHVTLGRVREPAPNPALTARLEALAGREFGEAPVDRVLLMKSELTPKGARYTALEQQLLSKGDT